MASERREPPLRPELERHQSERQHEHEHDELGAHEEREADACERERVAPSGRPRQTPLHPEERQDEGGIRGDLGEEKGGIDHPRHSDREKRRQGRHPALAAHVPREEKGRHARGAHEERAKYVSRHQIAVDAPVDEERREDQRVELVDAVHDRPVELGQRRAGPRDADRQPLVQKLVGHHEPVGDTTGEAFEREPAG